MDMILRKDGKIYIAVKAARAPEGEVVFVVLAPGQTLAEAIASL